MERRRLSSRDRPLSAKPTIADSRWHDARKRAPGSGRSFRSSRREVSFSRVSTGAIVAIGVVTLLMAGLVPLRVAVARQRRAVQAVRDRLAAAGEVRRHAKGV